MPKAKRRGRIPTPAWERQQGTLGRTLAGRSPQFYGTVAVILLVLGAIGLIGYGFASDAIAKRNRPGSTALQVDATQYTVRHYTERLKMVIEQFGGPTAQNGQYTTTVPVTSETLIREALFAEFAPEKNVTVTDDEIKQAIATNLSIKADDADFDNRYQQELTRTELTDAEYKQMITGGLLQKKIGEQFTTEVPATSESVHYQVITVADQATADKLKAQIEGGADFAQLARDNSTDSITKSQGGDAGWTARGVLDKGLEDALFALDIGQISTFPLANGVDILQVLENQADRAVEDAQRTTLGTKAAQDWLTAKRASATIKDDMDLNAGDTDKIGWAINHAYGL